MASGVIFPPMKHQPSMCHLVKRGSLESLPNSLKTIRYLGLLWLVRDLSDRPVVPARHAA